MNQTQRHQPYGSLQPILTPARLFYIIINDIILALSSTEEEYDCIVSATCKLSKATTFISDSSIWIAQYWALKLLV